LVAWLGSLRSLQPGKDLTLHLHLVVHGVRELATATTIGLAQKRSDTAAQEFSDTVIEFRHMKS
jgi:hypothetical protein